MLFIVAIIFSIYFLPKHNSRAQNITPITNNQQGALIDQALRLLKIRKDPEALAIFQEVLLKQPDNQDALWGKAEVLRRSRQDKESEQILEKILKNDPKHFMSLISLAHIRYKENSLNQARKLILEIFSSGCSDKETLAMANVMLGAINAKLSSQSGFINKIRYGLGIKGYFLKAKELAPDLAEVRMSLGAFYLSAPAIIGGNLNRAMDELELAVKIAPDFATANARLAQAYKKKGDLEKYNFYLQRARELNPNNEVLKEL